MTEVIPAVPDTIPDNIEEIGTVVSELTVESISGDMPCEINGKFFDKCQSNGIGKAEWLVTHEGGKPSCTFLICEPCLLHLQDWFVGCIVRGGGHGFGCTICKEGPFHYTAFIFNHL